MSWCHVMNNVISVKNTFCCRNLLRSFHIWNQNWNLLSISHFWNGCLLRLFWASDRRSNLNIREVTAITIYDLFFLNWEPSYLNVTFKYYNLLHWVKTYLWVKFGEDMSKQRSWVLRGNMHIPCKYEYKRLILSSRCDVICDVSNIKYFSWILHTLFPYLILNWSYLSKSLKFRKLQNWRNFRSSRTFSTEVPPEVQCAI